VVIGVVVVVVGWVVAKVAAVSCIGGNVVVVGALVSILGPAVVVKFTANVLATGLDDVKVVGKLDTFVTVRIPDRLRGGQVKAELQSKKLFE
jgi:hypothetical protein